MAQVMRNWGDVLPASVASAQRGFERRRAAYQMRQYGMTYEAIGKRLGVSRSRARELVQRRLRELKYGGRQPVEVYLDVNRHWDECSKASGWLKS